MLNYIHGSPYISVRRSSLKDSAKTMSEICCILILCYENSYSSPDPPKKLVLKRTERFDLDKSLGEGLSFILQMVRLGPRGSDRPGWRSPSVTAEHIHHFKRLLWNRGKDRHQPSRKSFKHVCLKGLSPMAQQGRVCLLCRGHRRLGLDPWVGKIPWRRAWQPTPVFLPEKSHGQRSPAGYSLQGHKELDTAEVT